MSDLSLFASELFIAFLESLIKVVVTFQSRLKESSRLAGLFVLLNDMLSFVF